MNKLETVKAELTKVGAKIAEFVGIRASTAAQLEDLQKQLLADKITPEQFFEAQRKLADAEASIEALNRRQAALQSELSPLEAAFSRSSRLATCKSLALEAQEAHAALIATYTMVDKALDQLAADLYAKRARLLTAKNEFAATVDGDDSIPQDLRDAGVPLRNVMQSKIGIPTMDYSFAVADLEGRYQSKMERETRKSSSWSDLRSAAA